MPHNVRQTITRLLAVAASVLLLGGTARAHEIIPGVTGFPALMLHPFFLTQQLLGIIIAGIVAGRTKPFTVWPFVLIFGISLVAAQLLFHAAPTVIIYLWLAAHLVILAAAGAIAAFGQLTPVASIPLFLLLATAIGIDIQPEGPTVLDTAQATAATFVTGTILILAISRVVSRTLPHWAEIFIRIVAAWVAASSLIVLALLFR